MTAAAPARPVTARAFGLTPLPLLRLLRIELRRSTMPWLLPLIAALFWFDSYRPSTGMPPLYVLRTFWNMGQGHTIIDFGPFVAGAAAWTGSRDGRRRTADLVAGTARPRWAAQLAAWAAAAIWAVAAYLAFTGAMFAAYAGQGVRGQPPWWWAAAGAAAVAAFSAAGFAAGAYWPSRFAAPLAAFGGFLAMVMSSQTGFRDTTGWALILPTDSNGNFQPDSGLLYPWLPDLPIARIMLLAGITMAALGLTGVRVRGDGPRMRLLAAAVTAAGVAAAGTAVGLAGTARLSAHGIVIPALHDAASDRPFRYAPACGQAAGVPVCVNPAYRRWLPDVTAALGPVFGEVAGLPGAPARAIQVGAVYDSADGGGGQPMTIGGRPPVLLLPLGAFGLPGAPGTTDPFFAFQLRLFAVHAFTGAGAAAGTAAQRAVQAALLHGAGVPFARQPSLLSSGGLPSWAGAAGNGGSGVAQGPVYDAARRLAALPAAARHAWLAAHLAALRSGQLTLARLP
ncbi:MAG TPA: hypothetical protein VKV35_01975 [Streptosporangiaceae bacterium]|jgi:hypothetical protein|nr:hypothetical protein [Streptosporangiaceae bacterium]